jgi:hypothetical protein
MLEELLKVLDQAADMNASMPIDIAGPCEYVFTIEEHTALMAMEARMADELLDAAEAGSMLTRILDARMAEQAKGAPVFRYPTPLEIRGDESWDLYQLFTKPT